MGTFYVAYALVWLAVSLYVLRLGVRQRELREELKSLETQIERMSAAARAPQ
jgi:CcmD family protein